MSDSQLRRAFPRPRATLLLLGLLVAVLNGAFGACPNDCSGAGICNAYSACECHRNWLGNDCSLRLCPFRRAFIDTPVGDLNSDGKLDPTTLVQSMMSNSPINEFFPETYGIGAHSLKDFSEGHFYTECSGKGTCDRGTGQCTCFAGYEGAGCIRAVCPSSSGDACSGHGVCLRLSDIASGYRSWDRSKTQQCRCDAGYEGIDCSQRMCPLGDDPVTKLQRITTACGTWGGPGGSQAINADAAKYGHREVFGTVSGAKGLLTFACGVVSTDARPRPLLNLGEVAAEAACRLKTTAAECSAGGPDCAWQAAFTQVTPEYDTEYCMTIAHETGLFAEGDFLVTQDGEFVLNATQRIARAYWKELPQQNEVQRLHVDGSVCTRYPCTWEGGTCLAKLGAAGVPDGLYHNLGGTTCSASSQPSCNGECNWGQLSCTDNADLGDGAYKNSGGALCTAVPGITKVYHLAPDKSLTCGTGHSPVLQPDCVAAVASIVAALSTQPAGYSSTLNNGNDGSCWSGAGPGAWNGVPSGCSLQHGSSWATYNGGTASTYVPMFNQATKSCTMTGFYTLVCYEDKTMSADDCDAECTYTAGTPNTCVNGADIGDGNIQNNNGNACSGLASADCNGECKPVPAVCENGADTGRPLAPSTPASAQVMPPGWKDVADLVCAQATEAQTGSYGQGNPPSDRKAMCEALAFDGGLDCSALNPFALTFKDEQGALFTTQSIECQAYSRTYTAATSAVPFNQPAGFALVAERHTAAEACRARIEAALEGLPNSVLVDVDVRDKNMLRDASDADAKDFVLDMHFISNSGDVNLLKAVGMGKRVNKNNPPLSVSIAEESKGTTDNTVCSSRGTCDLSTGICKCFQGFTHNDCSHQDALAMY